MVAFAWTSPIRAERLHFRGVLVARFGYTWPRWANTEGHYDEVYWP